MYIKNTVKGVEITYAHECTQQSNIMFSEDVPAARKKDKNLKHRIPFRISRLESTKRSK